MFNPKDFYRKLDSILTEIYTAKSTDVLPTVLNTLLDFLGTDLHIVDGRIYEDNGGCLDLIFSTGSRKYPEHIPMTDPGINLIIQHGCFIFNEPDDLKNTLVNAKTHTTPAAFELNYEEHHWFFVFELDFGWERDEIQFSLNTIRKVLFSRLSSEQFQNYISQAEMIQRSLLPTKAPAIENLDIAGRSVPTEIVGGDLYDYMEFDKTHLGIAIGDASGHGLPAALLVRDVVTGLRMGVEKHLKMTYAIERLNRVIHRSRLSTSFISLFYAEVESNGTVIYVNAGHPPPLLIGNDGFDELNVSGLVLGPLPDIQLKRGFRALEPGDILVLYTDGLIERTNALGEQFGIGNLKNVVFDHRNKPARDIVAAIFDAAQKFGNDSKWLDDVTAVVVKKIA
ncbi:PP2C family protein-serine/threonine phosphatase [candidate division KSB1 bacterium]|nr:PP2C family protein-serine/threonine phosphatase [candidate division KSB1 bacterium]